MLSHELIARYGILIVFLNVFGSSIGLPLPAAPTLVMVGASMSLALGDVSSSVGQFGAMLGAAVIGGALGDVVWFLCGKRYGTRALQWVCKLLPGQRTSIGQMERFFERYGVRVLMIARFIPGLSLVSVPLCGAVAIRWRWFVLHDCVGLGLWAAATLAVGAMFASQIEHTIALFWRFCWPALAAIALVLALPISCRFLQRVFRERTRTRAPGADTSAHIPHDATLVLPTSSCSSRPAHQLMRSGQHREPVAVSTAARPTFLR
ncbi:rhodanese domain-containing protein [Caballeronia hypogeia]|uniref:Rhodanese domain-containing protein n=1 Tax=Caballeronia hypogeia TaxID=1777140 RepID=A0A158DS25_9BURK|nr:DedA family protein [Caballeronia hypogeia]SAK97449.1 rhodanese domain-containing protein [Caballeronia hypogeia]